jgi:hypothetical protein
MPNFLIIGAQKAGTTSLYYYLKQHPQIYMTREKEAHFFSYENEKLNFRDSNRNLTIPITNIEDYRKLFQGVSNEIAIGEASPSYLYISKSVERIQHHIPDVKLIAILRNPIDRAYSNFLHCIKEGSEPLSNFKQALQAENIRICDNRWDPRLHYIQKGFYFTQLKRFFDRFDHRQIRVYLYEDLQNNPVGIVQEIFQFLSVDQKFVPDVSSKYNVSGIPKNKTLQVLMTGLTPISTRLKPLLPAKLSQAIKKQILMKPEFPLEMRGQLVQVYQEDILKLQDLIQRDISKWLV